MKLDPIRPDVVSFEAAEIEDLIRNQHIRQGAIRIEPGLDIFERRMDFELGDRNFRSQIQIERAPDAESFPSARDAATLRDVADARNEAIAFDDVELVGQCRRAREPEDQAGNDKTRSCASHAWTLRLTTVYRKVRTRCNGICEPKARRAITLNEKAEMRRVCHANRRLLGDAIS